MTLTGDSVMEPRRKSRKRYFTKEIVGDGQFANDYLKDMPYEHRLANTILHLREKHLRGNLKNAVGITRHTQFESDVRMVSVRAPVKIVMIAKDVLDKKVNCCKSQTKIQKLNEYAKDWIKYLD